MLAGIANFFGRASGKSPFESASCSETRLVVVQQHIEQILPDERLKNFAMTWEHNGRKNPAAEVWSKRNAPLRACLQVAWLGTNASPSAVLPTGSIPPLDDCVAAMARNTTWRSTYMPFCIHMPQLSRRFAHLQVSQACRLSCLGFLQGKADLRIYSPLEAAFLLLLLCNHLRLEPALHVKESPQTLSALFYWGRLDCH